MHLALLGDSIFDNKSYVGGAPDVRACLEHELGEHVTLLAVDGSVMDDIEAQLERLPASATHLALSIGGNDLRGRMNVLNQRVSTAADAFVIAASMAETFERDYAETLETVRWHKLPLLLCTIYNPHFPDPTMQRALAAALVIFNDCIIRQAARVGNPVLDLRSVVTEPTDFEYNIEPSGQGGAKIARAIAAVLREHDFTLKRTVLYP